MFQEGYVGTLINLDPLRIWNRLRLFNGPDHIRSGCLTAMSAAPISDPCCSGTLPFSPSTAVTMSLHRGDPRPPPVSQGDLTVNPRSRSRSRQARRVNATPFEHRPYEVAPIVPAGQ